MQEQDLYWMQEAIKEAQQALAEDEIPVLTIAVESNVLIEDYATNAFTKMLEESLGVKFEGQKGEHFFRSTLVQTLFYGLFASWVMWSQDHEPDDGATPGAAERSVGTG